jgi:endonuclease III
MNTPMLQVLIERHGGGFAKTLGIPLAKAEEKEIFKWFLASFLYGARISETIATRSYGQFERQKVLTPQAIQDTGWDGLVQILDAGGYVRYDFSTATKLLAVSGDLIKQYEGKLANVHAAASDPRDLERRLQKIGKGIGPVTANIFLRELRGILPKAEPIPSNPTLLAAQHLGLLHRNIKSPERMLQTLKTHWEHYGVPGHTFVDFEAALVRLGLRYCRKGKCEACPMAPWCLDASRKGKFE